MVDAIRELVEANPDADRESLALAPIPGVEEERGSMVEQGVQQEEEGLNVAWTMGSSNKSNVPHDAAFPTTLPPCNLDGSTLHTPYGLNDSELPAKIQVQLREFERWSTEPINLARGREYATPVQEATIAKQLELIRGYLGFMATKLGLPIVGLHNYWEPKTMAAFASMLLARGVGKHQVIKHLALARKVNTFLVSSSNLVEERQHADKMEAWLATLERQVAVVLPKPIKDASSLPKAGLVRKKPAFFIFYSKSCVIHLGLYIQTLSSTNPPIAFFLTRINVGSVLSFNCADLKLFHMAAVEAMDHVPKGKSLGCSARGEGKSRKGCSDPRHCHSGKWITLSITRSP